MKTTNIKYLHSVIFCPHCGHKIILSYRTNRFPQYDVIVCNLKAGGCNKNFVIVNETQVAFEPLKILVPVEKISVINSNL